MSSQSRINYGFCLIFGCGVITVSSFNYPAFSQPVIPKGHSLQQRKNPQLKNSCPQENLELLATELMKDLPGYANRASQRARRRDRSIQLYSYVLAAGKPDFQPLPLKSVDHTSPTYESSGVEQVFFTTLEREYFRKQVSLSQQFHRLLLTKTNSGWSVVMMFTATGSYPAGKPISPPRDTTDSAVGQGVKTWLRDCEAGGRR